MNKTYHCIAKTFFGLEQYLADELVRLEADAVTVLNRAVSFTCDKKTLYRINLCSRLSLSILVEWASFWARDEENFYKQMKSVDWKHILSPEKTFMIQTSIPRSKVFTHSQFIGLKAKDAIADYCTEEYGSRPNVDTADPDVKIHVYINGNKVSVSLNSSGEPLFKRGYRTEQAFAPINEVLAAGVLSIANWNGNRSLLDPMCGSGTFLIEAAMMAHQIPAGMRRRFGFQKWLNYTPDLFDQVYKEEVSKIKDLQVSIRGNDTNKDALAASRENISQAFLDDSIKVGRKDFFESEFNTDENPLIIMNPPYNKRLELDDAKAFYKQIGDQLKFKYAGAEAWIITADIEASKFIGLKPSTKIKLFNGPLECRLLQYKMYKGSKNKQ